MAEVLQALATFRLMVGTEAGEGTYPMIEDEIEGENSQLLLEDGEEYDDGEALGQSPALYPEAYGDHVRIGSSEDADEDNGEEGMFLNGSPDDGNEEDEESNGALGQLSDGEDMEAQYVESSGEETSYLVDEDEEDEEDEEEEELEERDDEDDRYDIEEDEDEEGAEEQEPWESSGVRPFPDLDPAVGEPAYQTLPIYPSLPLSQADEQIAELGEDYRVQPVFSQVPIHTDRADPEGYQVEAIYPHLAGLPTLPIIPSPPAAAGISDLAEAALVLPTDHNGFSDGISDAALFADAFVHHSSPNDEVGVPGPSAGDMDDPGPMSYAVIDDLALAVNNATHLAPVLGPAGDPAPLHDNALDPALLSGDFDDAAFLTGIAQQAVQARSSPDPSNDGLVGSDDESMDKQDDGGLDDGVAEVREEDIATTEADVRGAPSESEHYQTNEKTQLTWLQDIGVSFVSPDRMTSLIHGELGRTSTSASIAAGSNGVQSRSQSPLIDNDIIEVLSSDEEDGSTPYGSGSGRTEHDEESEQEFRDEMEAAEGEEAGGAENGLAPPQRSPFATGAVIEVDSSSDGSVHGGENDTLAHASSPSQAEEYDQSESTLEPLGRNLLSEEEEDELIEEAEPADHTTPIRISAAEPDMGLGGAARDLGEIITGEDTTIAEPPQSIELEISVLSAELSAPEGAIIDSSTRMSLDHRGVSDVQVDAEYAVQADATLNASDGEVDTSMAGIVREGFEEALPTEAIHVDHGGQLDVEALANQPEADHVAPLAPADYGSIAFGATAALDQGVELAESDPIGHQPPNPEVILTSKVEDSLPDPVLPPPDTTAPLPVLPLALETQSETSQSLIVEPPAEPINIVFDESIKSRPDVDADLPDPYVSPRDSAMPIPFLLQDPKDRASPSASLVVEPPMHLQQTGSAGSLPSPVISPVGLPDPQLALPNATFKSPFLPQTQNTSLPPPVEPSLVVDPPVVSPQPNPDDVIAPRDDLPSMLPDPYAPAPDSEVAAPLTLPELHDPVVPSPSLVVEAPIDTPVLSTPIPVSRAESPTRMPNPYLEPPDTFRTMPEVPHQLEPATPVSASLLVQAPEEHPEPMPVETGTAGSSSRAGAQTSAQEVSIDTMPKAVQHDASPLEAVPSRLRHHHGSLHEDAPSESTPAQRVTRAQARQSISLSPGPVPPVTRSHCYYRKLRISDDELAAVILVPQCTLADSERLLEEESEDAGHATVTEEHSAKGQAMTDDRPLLQARLVTKVHRIVGKAIFDEGHCFLLHAEEGSLAPEGEDVDVSHGTPRSHRRRKSASGVAAADEVTTNDVQSIPRNKGRDLETPAKSGPSTPSPAVTRSQKRKIERSTSRASTTATDDEIARSETPTRSKPVSAEPTTGPPASLKRKARFSVESTESVEPHELEQLVPLVDPVRSSRRKSRLSAAEKKEAAAFKAKADSDTETETEDVPLDPIESRPGIPAPSGASSGRRGRRSASKANSDTPIGNDGDDREKMPTPASFAATTATPSSDHQSAGGTAGVPETAVVMGLRSRKRKLSRSASKARDEAPFRDLQRETDEEGDEEEADVQASPSVRETRSMKRRAVASPLHPNVPIPETEGSEEDKDEEEKVEVGPGKERKEERPLEEEGKKTEAAEAETGTPRRQTRGFLAKAKAAVWPFRRSGR